MGQCFAPDITVHDRSPASRVKPVKECAGPDSKSRAICKSAQHTAKSFKPDQVGFAEPLELRVELVHLENLSDPEYRVGDLSRSLAGSSQQLHPYVDVLYCGQRKHTSAFQMPAGDRLVIREQMTFPQLAAIEDGKAWLTFSVFDARDLQAKLRGDPLIGKGTLVLTKAVLGATELSSVRLMRGIKCHGVLSVRVVLHRPSSFQRALIDSQGKPVRDVARALAEVLHRPKSMDALLQTRPPEFVGEQDGVGKVLLCMMLEKCVGEFLHGVSSNIDDWTSDDAAIEVLVRVARSVLQMIATYTASECDQEQCALMATGWLQRFISTSLEASCLPPKFRSEELQQLFSAEGAEVAPPQCRTGAVVAPYYWSNQQLQHNLEVKVVSSRLDNPLLELLTASALHPQCKGRDGGFDLSRVVGVKAFHVENVITWTQYCNKASEISARHARSGTCCEPVQPHVSEHSVFKWRHLCDASLNEVYLWHATKYEFVEQILNSGFDERVCSLHGLFGAGMYFAQDSCKAGQYAKIHNGYQYFFLCRVLLGRPFYAKGPMTGTRRAPEHHDSVVANSGAVGKVTAHRELVVYDRFQAYPEYLLEVAVM